jgi:lipopolysaccharide biosynthesis regulator YciM
MGSLKKLFGNNVTEKNKLSNPYESNSELKKLINDSDDFDRMKTKIQENSKAQNNFWKKEDELLNRGNEYFDKQKYKEAENIFRQLVEIGSKRSDVKETLIKIFRINNDKDGITWIKNKIEEQLNDPIDYHYEKSKLNKLKIKYSSDLYTNDELWGSFQKQLLNTNDFNQHSSIRSLMTEILLKEKNYKDAVFTILMSYRDEAFASYLMDTKLNSENYKRYFSKEYISGRIKRTVKKAKYEKLLNSISDLALKQIIKIPKDDMRELKIELVNLLNSSDSD